MTVSDLLPSDDGPTAFAKINAAIDFSNTLAANLALEASQRSGGDNSLTGLVAEINAGLGTKANATDLTTEAQARGAADAILAADRTVLMRPGDAPEAFTVSLAGGPPSVATALPPSLVAFGDNGFVARMTGAGLVAARGFTAVEIGRSYALRWVARRRADSTDPSDDAIQFGVAWYDQSHAPLATAVTAIVTLTNPTVANGRLEETGVVSTVAGTGVTVPPAGAAYLRPFVTVYGTTPVTDIEIVSAIDASNAVINAPDVSSVLSRVGALESINAGTRLTTIEGEIAAPSSLTFATLATFTAATVPSGVTFIQVLGNTVAGVGRQSYRRTTSVGPAPGLVQSADGSWWLRSDPVSFAPSFGADASGVADAGTALAAAQAFLPAGRSLTMDAGTYALAADVDMTGRLVDASAATFTGAGAINNALFMRALPTAVLAIGGNRGDVSAGLQIAGGNPWDGAAGNVLRAEGHASWTGFIPSRDLASMELAVHTRSASGTAVSTAGTNQLVWNGQGRAPDAAWIGRKLWFSAYLNTGVYRIAGVSGSTISLTNLDGSAFTFGSAITENYFVAWVYGTGTCTIAGTAVHRLKGDPFVLYFADPSFEFRINGVAKTVVGFTDTLNLTLSTAPGDTASATYEFWLDINNGQLTTFRLHRTDADVENLSIYTTPEGNWIEAQLSGYGRHRPIYLSSGTLPYSVGSTVRQVSIYPQALVLGGDFTWGAIRVLTAAAQPANYFLTQAPATGLSPSWAGRGADTNVGMSLDMQGTGNLVVSSHSYGATEFEVFGVGGTSWLAAGSDSGGFPALSAQGASGVADISVRVAPKGNGVARFLSSSNVNSLDIVGSASGLGVSLRGRGTDTNVGVGIDMQGTGALQITQGNYATLLLKSDSSATTIYKQLVLNGAVNAANDSAAATAGVPINGVYRNGSQLMFRVS